MSGPHSAPTVGIFDEPGIPLCLNSEWASFVDGALALLASRAYWKGTEAEIDAAVDQVEILLAALGEIGDCSMATVPIGATMLWWTDVIPALWLKMGQNVSKTTYPELFDIFGYTFGGGADIFVLPTMNGYSPFGAGASVDLGDTAGADSHNLSVDELPAHNHGVTDPGHNHPPLSPLTSFFGGRSAGSNALGSGATAGAALTSGSNTTGISTQNTGNGQAFSLLHPVRACNFIIYAGH